MGLFGFFSREKKESLDNGLAKTKESVFKKIQRAIVGKSKVDDEVLDNLEDALITSDVGVDTTLKIIKRLEERVARDKHVNTAEINKILKEEVVSLLNDREGRLWIGTNRGLDRFDHDTETFVHYPFPNNIQPRVSSLCQSKDGSILVGTSGYGIFKLGPSGKLEDVNASRREMYFSRLFEDSRGWVWKSGFDEDIVVYDGKKVTRFKSQVGNPQGFVEHDGEVLVVCLHGFMSYHS